MLPYEDGSPVYMFLMSVCVFTLKIILLKPRYRIQLNLSQLFMMTVFINVKSRAKHFVSFLTAAILNVLTATAQKSANVQNI